MPLKRKIVDGDDGAASIAGRDHVVEVSDRGAQSAQEARQPEGHPRNLALPLKRDRLDSVRDELWPTGHRRQPLPVCERRELAQERADVSLVTRATPPEDVRVDDDQRLQAAASR